jgi:hypothetical protein
MHTTPSGLIEEVFEVGSPAFESLALKIARMQYESNQVYASFCDAIRKNPFEIERISQLAYLPIGFFKTQKVITGAFEASVIFQSSGTTGSNNSFHYVKDLSVYEQSFTRGFRAFYGKESGYCILGLLPSYLEKGNSSLVYMVDHLIRQSGHPNSGFYLHDYQALQDVLLENETNKQPTLLIGVTYALLEFARQYPMALQYCQVMETGGMKGRGKELTREAVQNELMQLLGLNAIHSEYGMTELLSQAYSKSAGIFNAPPWMKILVREPDDPFQVSDPASIVGPVAGAVNIIDLANLHSCSFIATDDIGRLHPGGSFEILGRLDNCDIRGCGLMIT